MVRFPCSNCGARLKVPDDQSRQTATCPKCGRQVVVPDATVVSEQPASSPPPLRSENSAVPQASLMAEGRSPAAANGAIVKVTCLRCGRTFPCSANVIGNLVQCPYCKKPMTAARTPPPPPWTKQVHAWIESTPTPWSPEDTDAVWRILASWRPKLIGSPGLEIVPHGISEWPSDPRALSSQVRDSPGDLLAEVVNADVREEELNGRSVFIIALDRLSAPLRVGLCCDQVHLTRFLDLAVKDTTYDPTAQEGLRRIVSRFNAPGVEALLHGLKNATPQDREVVMSMVPSLRRWTEWRQELNAAPTLEGANFGALHLIGATLHGARLRRANLSGGVGILVDLCGADLTEAYVAGSDWMVVGLSEANCAGADFTKAKLFSVHFSGGDFSNAKFVDADLVVYDVGALPTFAGADFTRCRLKMDGAWKKFLQLLTPEQRKQLNLRSEQCFIATACCGNTDAWQVVSLRQFRDGLLLRSRLGRHLVELYYAVSPGLAQRIERHAWVQRLLRAVLITPVATVAGLLLRTISTHDRRGATGVRRTARHEADKR